MKAGNRAQTVEHAGKSYLQNIEKRWVGLHPAFAKWAKINAAQFKFEPFSHIFLSPMYRIGRWANEIQLA
eukprot:972243-Amphidinium_carterae.1